VNANEEVWFGITDGTSATVTITCATNCGAQPTWMNLSEWSGLATANVLDRAVAKDGLQSPARTGPLTTTGALALIVFAVADLTPNTIGAPAPGSWAAFASIETVAITQNAWYGFVPPGTYAPTVTETGNNWDAALVALHASATF